MASTDVMGVVRRGRPPKKVVFSPLTAVSTPVKLDSENLKGELFLTSTKRLEMYDWATKKGGFVKNSDSWRSVTPVTREEADKFRLGKDADDDPETSKPRVWWTSYEQMYAAYENRMENRAKKIKRKYVHAQDVADGAEALVAKSGAAAVSKKSISSDAEEETARPLKKNKNSLPIKPIRGKGAGRNATLLRMDLQSAIDAVYGKRQPLKPTARFAGVNKTNVKAAENALKTSKAVADQYIKDHYLKKNEDKDQLEKPGPGVTNATPLASNVGGGGGQDSSGGIVLPVESSMPNNEDDLDSEEDDDENDEDNENKDGRVAGSIVSSIAPATASPVATDKPYSPSFVNAVAATNAVASTTLVTTLVSNLPVKLTSLALGPRSPTVLAAAAAASTTVKQLPTPSVLSAAAAAASVGSASLLAVSPGIFKPLSAANVMPSPLSGYHWGATAATYASQMSHYASVYAPSTLRPIPTSVLPSLTSLASSSSSAASASGGPKSISPPPLRPFLVDKVESITVLKPISPPLKPSVMPATVPPVAAATICTVPLVPFGTVNRTSPPAGSSSSPSSSSSSFSSSSWSWETVVAGVASEAMGSGDPRVKGVASPRLTELVSAAVATEVPVQPVNTVNMVQPVQSVKPDWPDWQKYVERSAEMDANEADLKRKIEDGKNAVKLAAVAVAETSDRLAKKKQELLNEKSEFLSLVKKHELARQTRLTELAAAEAAVRLNAELIANQAQLAALAKEESDLEQQITEIRQRRAKISSTLEPPTAK